MKKQFYDSIFKRKSFHFFRNVGDDKIGQNELEDIEKAYVGYIGEQLDLYLTGSS